MPERPLKLTAGTPDTKEWLVIDDVDDDSLVQQFLDDFDQ